MPDLQRYPLNLCIVYRVKRALCLNILKKRRNAVYTVQFDLNTADAVLQLDITE